MDEQELKQAITQVFDTVSSGYDNHGLRFFQKSAEQLPGFFQLKGGENLLDNATGTGRAAIVLANHLPEGKITGVDLSSEMLAQARQKAKKNQLTNTEFRVMDIESLDFPDQHFDHANCSFCLFFLSDMVNALQHIKSKVKAGGKIISCCFSESSFQPQNSLFIDRIQSYGVEVSEGGFKRLSTEEKNIELYHNAGLKNVQVFRRELGYYQKNAEEWWDIIWYAGYRAYVNQLSDEQMQHFKAAHLQEVQALSTEKGIYLPMDILFAVGEV